MTLVPGDTFCSNNGLMIMVIAVPSWGTESVSAGVCMSHQCCILRISRDGHCDVMTKGSLYEINGSFLGVEWACWVPRERKEEQ